MAHPNCAFCHGVGYHEAKIKNLGTLEMEDHTVPCDHCEDNPRCYMVFVRNWWKRNPSWPQGLEPDPTARKTTLRKGLTYKEAQQMCKEYNATHKPGKLSRKAEFTS